MSYYEEIFQDISAIYKYVFANKEIHRNTLRKKLLTKGKIASKNKFAMAFDCLMDSDFIKMEKEVVTVNPSIIELGVLQKKDNEFFVVTPKSKKHYKINKSIAAGYKLGDLVDVIIQPVGKQKEVVVLGKSKTTTLENREKKTPSERKSQALPENCILGRVVKVSHDDLVFIPNKKSIQLRHIPILNNREEFSLFQDKICVMRLDNMEIPLNGGVITEVKGDAGNPIHEYDAIAESYGAIMNWQGANIEKEISMLPSNVNVDDLPLITQEQAQFLQKGHVVDLRNIPFVTVDPATCKDMDDAIYSTIDENGDIVCYTAVANVTKYVDLDTEIGERYLNGSFTIYAPNKAYNILPTKLSTGICSLNPNEDRLAFVVKTIIDKNTGKAKDSCIYDAVIQSRQKYSYEQAQEIVDNLEQSGTTKSQLINKIINGDELSQDEQVLMNYYSAQAIKAGFEQRKMIRFVSNKERDIVFDDDFKNVIDIETVPHLQYHEVIESFMVTANESTAKYARDNKLNNIYRVHDSPNPRKEQKANEFFRALGVKYRGDLSAEGTRTLIDMIRNTEKEEVINNFLIKMQSRAVYSDSLYNQNNDENNIGLTGEKISHFALQSPHYSHTTSPIRRIPDYVTQYNILAHMHGTKPLSGRKIEKIVATANKRQLDIEQAEKDFEDISSVLYCEQHIGERLSGNITKFRYTAEEEGYNDSIIVIVKDLEKGINAEIPLSQVIGRQTRDCEISRQRCAVTDGKGNVLISLCKPIDFIIEKADRKSMIVVGKTNKELIKSAESRQEGSINLSKAEQSRLREIRKRYKDLRQSKVSDIKRVEEEINERF